jgi:hypothetical protein
MMNQMAGSMLRCCSTRITCRRQGTCNSATKRHSQLDSGADTPRLLCFLHTGAAMRGTCNVTAMQNLQQQYASGIVHHNPNPTMNSPVLDLCKINHQLQSFCTTQHSNVNSDSI